MAVSPRVPRHVQTVAVLWLVYAGWTVLTWLVALPFLMGVIGRWRGGDWGGNSVHAWAPYFGWLVPFVTAIVLGRALLSLAVGVGLLRRASWGRMLAIVMAFLTLIKPITGTLLAIYTLWVFLPASSGYEYRQIAPGAGSIP